MDNASASADKSTGAPQIEVTPEMIEAGAAAIFEHREFFTAWDLSAKVYQAMEMARVRRT